MALTIRGIDQATSATIAAYTASAPVRLAELAKALGIQVASDRSLPNSILGKIEPVSEGRFRITLNDHFDSERCRFTLACEIGHFILHRELIRDSITHDAMYQSKLGGACDREAHQLAAELLMPEQLVRKQWASGTKSFVAMANEFQVAPIVARDRMAQLRLI